jgi:NAD(P)-dependent dehydrogenase (short-subunit alcohol dehydrogenase family)
MLPAMAKGKALSGQVALITGGGSGVGRAVSLALGARGVRVVVAGRDERPLGETVGEIAYGGGKARHLVADVREPAQVQAAVARAIEVFGGLDLVVSAAGLASDGEPGEVLATNLIGAHATFKAALDAMKGGGTLLAAGRALDASLSPAHAAARAGVVALVHALATELRPKGITCNAISGENPEEVADLAVLLCERGLSGQLFSLS